MHYKNRCLFNWQTQKNRQNLTFLLKTRFIWQTRPKSKNSSNQSRSLVRGLGKKPQTFSIFALKAYTNGSILRQYFLDTNYF